MAASFPRAVRGRYALASLVLFTFLATLFLTQNPTEARHRPWRGPHVTEDGWYYYHWLRSAAFDHDLDLANDYREFGNWYGFGVTATGRPHNPFGIGPALFFAPGFAVGHVVAKLGAQDRPDTVANGYSRAEQTGALAMSFFAAAGAFWLTFALCRRYVSARAAWLGTALAFLGSPLGWYAVFSPSMPHAFEALFGSAFLWAVLPLRQRTRREAVMLGVISGGMLLARPQLAIFLMVPIAEAAFELGRRRASGRPTWPPVASLGATMLVALAIFSPQLFAWKAVYGSWLVVPQGKGFLRLGDSLWLETLFSSRNGLFIVTPLLWFVMPGLYFVTRQDRKLGAMLTAMLLVQAFINGAAWDWWGGGAFGGRRFAVTFPIWALALSVLGATLAADGRLRRLRTTIAGALALALLALQGAMVTAHHRHELPWDAPISLERRVEIATGQLFRARGTPTLFAFPANALFAVRHGVPLARYDLSVGPYLLDERLPTTNPQLPRKHRETVVLSSEQARAFLGRGFTQTPNGAELRGASAELLLPLNRPGGLALELDVTPANEQSLRWSFNGERLAAPRLAIEAAWVRRGVNVLRVESLGSAQVVVRAITLIEGDDWPPGWAIIYERGSDR